jgi:hypothetical protein
MTNLDMIPGVSVYRLDFFDQNGLLYSICQTLNEKQVDYIKLANIGIIPPGWLGSAVISWQCSSGSPGDIEAANRGALGVVVVEKASGYASGDLTKAYEGFPLPWQPAIPMAVPCPECGQLCASGAIRGQVTSRDGTAIAGALVSLFDEAHNLVAWTVTDSGGGYEFVNVPGHQHYDILVVKDGYLQLPDGEVWLDCGEQEWEDIYVCAAKVSGTAKLTPGGTPLVGKTVELWERDGTQPFATTKTNSEGQFTFLAVPCGKYHLKILFLCQGNLVAAVSEEFAVVFGVEANVLVDLENCTGWWDFSQKF